MANTNLAGSRFGHVSIIQRSGNLGRRAAWECLCDCGKTFIAATCAFTYERRTTCPSCSARDRVLGTVRTTEESFWAKVDKRGEDDCWEWTAQRIKGNFPYGKMMYRKERWLTHRLAWFFTNGDIPDGLFVCHKCDNPLCCNPTHLFLGTHQDNVDDRENKGRNKVSRGEANNKTYLTWEQVCEIRRLCSLPDSVQAQVARFFNTTPTVVNGIVKGKTWLYPK